MKLIKTTLFAAAASVAMGGAAFAQDAAPFDFSFNVGAASDYVFRGVSQTDENPQVFGGVDATIGGIGYAGVWISNVDFGGDTNGEVDIYAGVKPTLGPINLDLGVVYYGYLNQASGADEDYVEWKVAGSTAVGPATVGAVFFYSSDFFGGTGEATYFELNGSAPVAEKVSVSGAIGKQNVEGPFDYTTWNLGVGYALTDKVGLDLRYHDTDEHGFGDIYDSRVVAGIKVVF
ncbi:TorF family putative porin [Phenylobacterium sp.]|uniref:TorF family putative porin n=1 Tax=Phenylobacterium sp. TaxID=1871053 RepID=UPI00286AC83C|nr:TorF family putative porin [Phenylobacterium sp.]